MNPPCTTPSSFIITNVRIVNATTYNPTNKIYWHHEQMKQPINLILAGSILFYFYVSFLHPNTLPNEVPWSTKQNNKTASKVDVILAPTATMLFKSSETISLRDDKESYMSRFLHDAEGTSKRGLHNAFIQLSKTAPSHAKELFKYCFMLQELESGKTNQSIFREDSTFLLDEEILSADKNYVVFDEETKVVHGSLLVISIYQKTILREMIDFVIEKKDRFQFDPSILARQLFNLIQIQISEGIEWQVLKLVCDLNRGEVVKYGCQAQLNGQSVLLSPYQYLPSQPVPVIDRSQRSPSSSLSSEADKPFITTITSRSTNRKPFSTPNFFHIISDKECLPTNRICEACMKDFRGGSCSKCRKFCGCFCDSLCQTLVQDKVLTKVFEYAPPVYKRHIDGSAQSGRLIPRIVHQTWFEQITRDK